MTRGGEILSTTGDALMKAAFTSLCLGILVADTFFCGGGRQPLTTAQQSKFDADAKRAGDDLSAVEDALKAIEAAPGEAAFAELAALDQKLAAAEESIKDVHKDFTPKNDLDEPRRNQLTDVENRHALLDERLTAVYRQRLGAAACARLDAAVGTADRLDIILRNLQRAEETPPGQLVAIAPVPPLTDREGGRVTEGNTLVSTDMPRALREMDEQIAGTEAPLAAAQEFIDGPSRDHVRAALRKRLETAVTRRADLAKRCAALRAARGVE
jgi:hypothetical protein